MIALTKSNLLNKLILSGRFGLKKSLLGFLIGSTLLNVLYVQHVFAEPLSQSELHTRSLAASCAACHGTQGNAVGGVFKLAGLESAYFVTQMQAFKSGERKGTVMHRHAIGLTDDEIANLAQYFAQQIPLKMPILHSQTLSKIHD